MKKIDISESVMKKVTRFEQSRTSTWLGRFYGGVVLLSSLLIIYTWISWQTITDLQGWDLLTIFMQDKEIIRDYWQDTVVTFIEELPLETILLALVMLVILIFVVLKTRKSRKVYEHRMRELAKHGDIRKNSK